MRTGFITNKNQFNGSLENFVEAFARTRDQKFFFCNSQTRRSILRVMSKEMSYPTKNYYQWIII
jgi:hypothetical protein